MPIGAVVSLMLQLLPILTHDGPALVAALSTAADVVKRAQANGGGVSANDWAALDAMRMEAEAAFKAALS